MSIDDGDYIGLSAATKVQVRVDIHENEDHTFPPVEIQQS